MKQKSQKRVAAFPALLLAAGVLCFVPRDDHCYFGVNANFDF